jgi:hypothetical protein
MGRNAITRTILITVSRVPIVCLCWDDCQYILLLLCWNSPVSDMACYEKKRNENHDAAEGSAENLHEGVKCDVGMGEIDGIICLLVSQLRSEIQGVYLLTMLLAFGPVQASSASIKANAISC